MPIRKLFAVSALMASVLVPSVSFAAGPSSHHAPCILNEHRVSVVKPYKVTEQRGRGTYQRLRGAQIFVAAEPGLTPEWLELKLQRHLQQMQTADMKDCAFDVNSVRVEVASAGNGFWVKLIAKDSDKGEEVLRRARLLVGA
jgi:hypothetical protein